MNQKLLILFFLLLAYSQLASASFITLETTTYTNSTFASISIKNKGDEPAYNIQLSLVLPTTILKSTAKPKLEINEASIVTFPLIQDNLKPGSYPLIIIIDYMDANNYPFSAISTSFYNIMQPTSSNLLLSMQPIKLSGNNKLKLSIKNLDNEAKNVKARIIAPKELTIDDEKTITIPARDQETITFNLEDFSARPDSSYAVFAIVEYEDSQHYTAITSTIVRIVKDIGIPTSILTGALAGLILIYISYKVYKKKHESKHSNPDTK